jgi:hypothetical protein
VDLADAIEVDVINFIHPIQDFGYLPFHVTKRAPQSRLLSFTQWVAVDQLRTADEQHQRFVVV